MRLILATLVGFLWPVLASADPQIKSGWSWAYQTGVMTDNRAGDALNPANSEWVENYLLGFLLGYEKPWGETRFTFGAEFQANAHFGNQGFYELVVPVTLRYHPESSWWNAFDSFAAGLGYSHYSELSDIELSNYDGEGRRNLFYWFIELEFAELNARDNLFVRIHHRSNAFDTVTPNGGSNALVVGFRRRF